jgi:DNA polymerase
MTAERGPFSGGFGNMPQKVVFNPAASHYPWAMNSPSAQSLTLNELFQLVHFYAESGVDWVLEDEPQDRFAEFAAMEAARARPAERVPAEIVESRPQRQQARAAPPPPIRTPVAIPDAEAVAESRRIAAAATTLDELAAAVSDFGGCNLRNSARMTAFMSGNTSARIAIAGGISSADDDRDGQPFSGPAGAMLAKMLAGIGVPPDDVLTFNLIPWRPPGNRLPTPNELDICRPFGMRLIELLRPQAVLALGNFSARFFSGSNETIHGLRGRWMEVEAGGAAVPIMATFHPQDLVAAPLCKRFAWADLLAFRAKLTN